MAYEQTLVQTGLTSDQAGVYETLVKTGPLPASLIPRRGGLQISRPLVYKVLEQLMTEGLVEKKEEPQKVAIFAAAHPLKLKELIEKRLGRAKQADIALSGIVDKLTGDFNLAGGKPGIRFFEDKEGVREVMNDALTSKTDIYSYVDIDAVEREIPEISRDFAKARRKLGLRKKNIGVDTPENRKAIENYFADVTEERLIPWPTQSFGTVMQIYDGKVSYFTLGDRMIGVVIADKHIYEMHRSLFEFTWQNPLAYIPKKVQTAAEEEDGGANSISDVGTP